MTELLYVLLQLFFLLSAQLKLVNADRMFFFEKKKCCAGTHLRLDCTNYAVTKEKHGQLFSYHIKSQVNQKKNLTSYGWSRRRCCCGIVHNKCHLEKKYMKDHLRFEHAEKKE